jgi:hypothetical protein
VAKGLLNGGGTYGTADCLNTSDTKCYPQSVGGVDDYNRTASMPSDTYNQTWITCNSSDWSPSNPGGNYCNTGREVLNGLKSLDPNTGLVWSPRIYDGSGSYNWFWANNCKYPNGLPGDDGVCDADKEVACQCVKHTGQEGDAKTGCEAYDDGNWRLPSQKELMQSYIYGSWDNLANAGTSYWSSATLSHDTHSAWIVSQGNGYTDSNPKTTVLRSVKCVR